MSVERSLVDLVSATSRLTRVAARLAGGTESPALWRTLGVLGSTGPMRLGALASESRVSQPTMTKIVNTLEHAGSVRRRADAADARATVIEITADGEAALEDWRAQVGAALAPLFSDLGPDDEAAIRRVTAIIAERIATQLADTPDSPREHEEI